MLNFPDGVSRIRIMAMFVISI